MYTIAVFSIRVSHNQVYHKSHFHVIRPFLSKNTKYDLICHWNLIIIHPGTNSYDSKVLDLHRFHTGGPWRMKKIANFSVMRLHSEKAHKTTQFYNIYSLNNDLLHTYKIPSIFLVFSCFLFHYEIIFCVKSTAQKRIYVYRYIFS